MIRLYALGSVGLTDDAGREVSAVLRQPKRFGLLTYLALSGDQGFRQRETLLALFWPDLDGVRARAALRQSLYVLRRTLEGAVIVNRGDAVGCAPDALWCDVRAFQEAVEAGEPELALELYRGPFLDGFHVVDASPRFDYWLEDERERLRRLAVGAAWEAVSSAESEGDASAARRYAARAVELAPFDEASVRRQLELFERLGDRTGGIAAFEQWEERLREELELEPSPETRALVEQLKEAAPQPDVERHVAERRKSPPPAPPAAGPTASATPGAPASLPSRSGDRMAGGGGRPGHGARGRRAWPVAVATLVALAIVAVGVLGVLGVLGVPGRGDTAAEAAAEAERVVVLPFSYQGPDNHAYVADGLLYLMSVGLDGGDLRTVPPDAVLRAVDGGPGSTRRAERTARLVEDLRAGLYVRGNVVASGDRLDVVVTLYRRGVDRPVARASGSGALSSLASLAEELSAALLTDYRGRKATRVTRVASLTTRSLPALKSFLSGEELLRAGRFEEAVAAFQEAVLQDEGFALAYYRMSVAASWDFRGDLSTRAAEQAVAHAERLPDREHRLLEAQAAYRNGRASEARSQLRRLMTLYPNDAEVLDRLGELIMHLGPLQGWSIQEARAPFTKAADLGLLVPEALYHLAQIETGAADTAAAVRYIRRALAAAPRAGRVPQLRVLQSLLARDAGAFDAVADSLESADDFTLISAVYNAAVYAGRPDAGRRLARLVTDADRPADVRLFGYFMRADLDLATGRWSEARSHVEAMRGLSPRRADQVLAMVAGVPGFELSPAQRNALARRLREAAPASGTVGGRWWPQTEYQPAAQHYFEGLALLSLHSAAEVQRVEAQLRASEFAVGAELAAALDIQLHGAERGEVPTTPPVAVVSPELSIVTPLFSQPAARYWYGRRLERAGRLREALAWLESLQMFSVLDLPWATPALLDEARIHETLGEVSAARECYRRYLDRMRAADPGAPGIATARDGLARTDPARSRRTPVARER